MKDEDGPNPFSIDLCRISTTKISYAIQPKLAAGNVLYLITLRDFIDLVANGLGGGRATIAIA